ncbi:Bax inhibitor-1/YccA family protein [Nonomuraea sediminis]|uniref:Bax inhibitor-1/YccA family protein n=1 Tax=Nonomuraea sediminis TaxID=2835864 RepID=UPI001BDC9CBD|nr:Bax inhibitor-1/YccA family protein [Nonomuraea sediminis]
MKSSNPILSRWSTGPSGSYQRGPVNATAGDYGTNPYVPPTDTSREVGSASLTMDHVIVRTATTLGIVVLTAVLSWLLLPVDEANLGRSYGIAVAAAVIAFVLSIIQVFKPTPSPALILGYAAFEGVFLGVFSSTVSTHIAAGVVGQAVLGTFAVSAGTLIAYRMRWIRVTQRFAGFVGAAAMGFLLLLVADALFSAFGAGNGLGFHSGVLGIVFGLVGIVLGAAFLALDFKQVEDAIAHGAPDKAAWLAAFGLTTTLVWIYLEVLQVLTIFKSDN